jgi:hypothetical protein
MPEVAVDDAYKHRKRTDTVLGILIASALGFVLNLLANVYYDVFVTKTVSWGSVDRNQIIFIPLALVGLIGFLQFFIYDFKNDLEINKNFWLRFANYFFFKFKLGRILSWIMGLYLILLGLAILIGIYVLMSSKVGYSWTTILFLVIFLYHYEQNRKRN